MRARGRSFLTRWFRRPQDTRRRGPHAALAVTELEARDCPSVYTFDGTQTITLHAGRAGATVKFEVAISTSDPNDAGTNEGENLVIHSNTGAFADKTFPTVYGQSPVPTPVSFTATQADESITAFIDGEGADGDEQATIITPGTVIPKKVQPNTDGSLVVTYQVSDPLEPGQTVPIGLYWASGPNGSDALSATSPHQSATSVHQALFEKDVTSQQGPGTYTFTVPNTKLTTAAAEVKDLLVVADPDNNLGSQGDPNAVLAVVAHTDDVTAAQLRKLIPSLSLANATAFAPALNQVMSDFGITTLEQRAMFLGQLAAESNDLTRWHELWTARANFQLPGVNRPPHTATSQQDYFNYWYGGRLGNGNSSYQGGHSNDGFTFRGRGPIQLTGRDNYQAFANFMHDQSIMTNPDQLGDSAHPLLGFESAAWYFSQRVDLISATNNAAGQASDVFNRTITVAINGGTNGLATRLANYRRIRAAMLDPNF
jgi:putative chitinase